MDEYKTRLYTIACRAPITEVHKSAVKECPLYTQYLERKKLRDSRVSHVVGLLRKHCKWDSDQGVMIRYKFSRFVLLAYNLALDDPTEWVVVTTLGRNTFAHKLYMSYKQAHAALAYAETIINTPEEYLTLTLPVNENIPRAILALPEYAAQMQECIDKGVDEEELSNFEALVETIVQEDIERKAIEDTTFADAMKQQGYNNVFPAILTFLGLLGLVLYLIF